MKKALILLLLSVLLFSIDASRNKEGIKFIPSLKASLIPPLYQDDSALIFVYSEPNIEIVLRNKFTLSMNLPFRFCFLGKTGSTDSEYPCFTINPLSISLGYMHKDGQYRHTFLMGCSLPLSDKNKESKFDVSDKFFRIKGSYSFSMLSDPTYLVVGMSIGFGIMKNRDNTWTYDPLQVGLPFSMLVAFNKNIATRFECNMSMALPKIQNNNWSNEKINYSVVVGARVIISLQKNYFQLGISKDILTFFSRPQIDFCWSMEI